MLTSISMLMLLTIVSVLVILSSFSVLVMLNGIFVRVLTLIWYIMMLPCISKVPIDNGSNR